MSGTSCFKVPATLCILVISSASSKLKSGNMLGSLLASIVFPGTGTTEQVTGCAHQQQPLPKLFLFFLALLLLKSQNCTFGLF